MTIFIIHLAKTGSALTKHLTIFFFTPFCAPYADARAAAPSLRLCLQLTILIPEFWWSSLPTCSRYVVVGYTSFFKVAIFLAWFRTGLFCLDNSWCVIFGDNWHQLRFSIIFLAVNGFYCRKVCNHGSAKVPSGMWLVSSGSWPV